MSAIRGYPSKLKIYRIRGSRFWQARCYMGGKMYVRSTRTAEKLQASEAAKHFYEELLLRLRKDGDSEVDRLNRAQLKEPAEQYRFQSVAANALEGERGRMMRGEVSLQSFKALRNRMNLQILPVLGQHDIRTLRHDDLSRFVDGLVKRKVSSITISQYLQSIRMVFKFALINQSIDKTPPLSQNPAQLSAKGWFYFV